MNKTSMMYFDKDDVLHLAISDEPEAGSVEISPGITAELNVKGDLIGIEILHASRFIRDSVMESVQAKMLGLVGERHTAIQVAEAAEEYPGCRTKK